MLFKLVLMLAAITGSWGFSFAIGSTRNKLTRSFTKRLNMKAHTLSSAEAAGLLARIEENNSFGGKHLTKDFVPFSVEGKIYGYVSPDFAKVCANYPDAFAYENDALMLSSGLDTPEKRSDTVQAINRGLRDDGVIKGWREEMLPVVESFSSDPIFLIERAAYSYFGMKGYGVHVNGYVRDDKGEVAQLWVAKRAKDKSTWPGMLDHVVAGGQPYGISPTDNVIKECGEEANIPEEIARTALSAGAVSYSSLDELGNLKRDALFCYDLELARDFTPTPVDGEVESFKSYSIPEIINILVEGGPGGYKPNCSLVVIDFLIRHGLIAPESPRYLEIVSGLRVPATCK